MEFVGEALLAAAPNFVTGAVDGFVTKPVEGVPFPKGAHPVLGHLRELTKNIHRLHDWRAEVAFEMQKLPNYPGCFQMVIPMNPPAIVITDPELLQYVLDKAESHPHISQNSATAFDLLSGAFGKTSIFMVDGQAWSRRRKYYAHLFSLRSLREVMLPQFEINSQKIQKRIDRHIQSDEAFDIQDIFARATLDAISQIAFAQDMGCLDSDEAPEFMKHFDRSQEITYKRTVDILWRLKRRFKIGYEQDLLESIKFVNDHIYKMLEDRKQGKYRADQFTILDLFERKAKKEGQALSPTELRDICWDFLIAGRDTTACASTWLVYYLATKPDVTAKIRKEMEGKNLRDCNVLLHELPYLTACCLEVERLKPSVPGDNKGVTGEFTLPNGVKVGPGMPLIFQPYVSGRNPKYWGADVLEFKPERWLNESGDIRQVSEGKYPQFNGGPRLCLGKTMALLELKNIITSLLPKYDFELADDREVTYVVAIILWVKGGLWVRAKPRQQQS